MFKPNVKTLSNGTYEAQMISPSCRVRIWPLYIPQGESFYSKEAAQQIADKHCTTANRDNLKTYEELKAHGYSVVEL